LSDNIKLHPKYGLNPSISVCFWCGGDTGEILLLGFNKDKEASRKTVASYEPCAKCKEQMAQGITLVEVEPRRGQQRPEIVPGGIPTGRWLVIKEEAFTALPILDEMKASVLKSRRAVMERAVFETFLPEDKKAAQPEKSDGEKS
jgi:hypothetical protein